MKKTASVQSSEFLLLCFTVKENYFQKLMSVSDDKCLSELFLEDILTRFIPHLLLSYLPSYRMLTGASWIFFPGLLMFKYPSSLSSVVKLYCLYANSVIKQHNRSDSIYLHCFDERKNLSVFSSTCARLIKTGSESHISAYLVRAPSLLIKHEVDTGAG